MISAPLAAATTTAINCGSGGTIGITLDDIDGFGALSTGDKVTMAFNSCNEGGSITNGTVAVSNVVLTKSTSTAYTFSGVIAINLGFTDGPDSGTIAGTMTFEESSADSITVTTTLGISSLVATIGSETLTMTDFSTTVTENTDTGAYTIASNGTVNSSKLGGTVTIGTPTTFRGFGSAYPSSGAIQILGLTQA